tara:strand:+ start:2252 stop:2659 length:408 start_codon:yes stop_codon:yes gene_type:complete
MKHIMNTKNYRNKPLRGLKISNEWDNKIKKSKTILSKVKLGNILCEPTNKIVRVIKRLVEFSLELFIFGLKGEKYKMDSLIRDIKKEGYKPKKYGYIIVEKKDNHLYDIVEGEHRVKALIELYGKDYSIDVKIII